MKKLKVFEYYNDVPWVKTTGGPNINTATDTYIVQTGQYRIEWYKTVQDMKVLNVELYFDHYDQADTIHAVWNTYPGERIMPFVDQLTERLRGATPGVVDATKWLQEYKPDSITRE